MTSDSRRPSASTAAGATIAPTPPNAMPAVNSTPNTRPSTRSSPSRCSSVNPDTSSNELPAPITASATSRRAPVWAPVRSSPAAHPQYESNGERCAEAAATGKTRCRRPRPPWPPPPLRRPANRHRPHQDRGGQTRREPATRGAPAHEELSDKAADHESETSVGTQHPVHAGERQRAPRSPVGVRPRDRSVNARRRRRRSRAARTVKRDPALPVDRRAGGALRPAPGRPAGLRPRRLRRQRWRPPTPGRSGDQRQHGEVRRTCRSCYRPHLPTPDRQRRQARNQRRSRRRAQRALPTVRRTPA